MIDIKQFLKKAFCLHSYDYTDPGIIMHGYRAGDWYVTCEKCGKRKRI